MAFLGPATLSRLGQAYRKLLLHDTCCLGLWLLPWTLAAAKYTPDMVKYVQDRSL